MIYFELNRETATLDTEIEGLSAEWLQRYVETRRRVDAEANSIFAITSMLALLETNGDDKIEVDPVALGKINQMLNKNILNIWEILDNFIYIVHAKSILEEKRK